MLFRQSAYNYFIMNLFTKLKLLAYCSQYESPETEEHVEEDIQQDLDRFSILYSSLFSARFKQRIWNPL
jgi:hypothetical protein